MTAQLQAMHDVGVISVIFCSTGDVCSDDVDVLAAKTAVNLIEPDGGPPFGGKK